MSDEAWQQLVDLDALRSWMDGQHLGQGPLQAVTPLQGGTQNVLLRFERDGRVMPPTDARRACSARWRPPMSRIRG